MDLKDYRDKINDIDEQMVRLFEERMEVSAEIAKYKKENRLPIYDGARERSKLEAVNEQLPEHLRDYGLSLYSLLMDLSKTYQHRTLGESSEVSERIEQAIRNTPPLFPEKAVVACQGVEGAYSQTAAERLFKYPNLFFFETFDAVFSAVDKGLCRYGVLPVENSTAGTVNRVYDLMLKHHFHIVRSVRVKIDHNLLVKPGTKLQDIREVYSHEQAISQCRGFLSKLSGVKAVPVENTAVAAKIVASSDRTDVAALSSRSCMDLYGLTCLKASVQDSSNNYTRFVCIAKDPEIYPGADRTSLMMVLPHTPGSLYKVLSRFYALGINLNKLESRPLPDRNFEFMFYFDLENSVYSPRFTQLMADMDSISEEFIYLGSYSEIV